MLKNREGKKWCFIDKEIHKTIKIIAYNKGYKLNSLIDRILMEYIKVQEAIEKRETVENK